MLSIMASNDQRKTLEMVFACKKCKKTFRKDMSDYEEEDEFCPHCDNQYVIEAKTKDAQMVRLAFFGHVA